jgi:hypothetical protein
VALKGQLPALETKLAHVLHSHQHRASASILQHVLQ